MAQTIKIDQLADTVMKGMEEYAKLAAEDLKKDVQKAGKSENCLADMSCTEENKMYLWCQVLLKDPP